MRGEHRKRERRRFPCAGRRMKREFCVSLPRLVLGLSDWSGGIRRGRSGCTVWRLSVREHPRRFSRQSCARQSFDGREKEKRKWRLIEG